MNAYLVFDPWNNYKENKATFTWECKERTGSRGTIQLVSEITSSFFFFFFLKNKNVSEETWLGKGLPYTINEKATADQFSLQLREASTRKCVVWWSGVEWSGGGVWFGGVGWDGVGSGKVTHGNYTCTYRVVERIRMEHRVISSARWRVKLWPEFYKLFFTLN